VISKPSLRFPSHPHWGLEESEGDVAVEPGVVGEVDPLLAALAQEPLHLVPAIGE
jgi:hypothetical protein